MENNHVSPSPVVPLANVARDNAGIFAPYLLTLANRNAQGGQAQVQQCHCRRRYRLKINANVNVLSWPLNNSSRLFKKNYQNV